MAGITEQHLVGLIRTAGSALGLTRCQRDLGRLFSKKYINTKNSFLLASTFQVCLIVKRFFAVFYNMSGQSALYRAPFD